MSVIHDIRFERLARQAPDHSPLLLSPEDEIYVLANLTAVGDAFGLRAEPHAALASMTARGVARHLAALRSWLDPRTQEQELALGRLESIYRLLATAVRLMELRSRQTA